MSALWQESPIPSKRGEALKRLNTYFEDWRQRKKPIGSLEALEREVHERIIEVEQEIVAEGLSQFDLDAPVVEVDGQRYSQVYRGQKSYLSAAGEVRVERSLYRAQGGKAICPLEMQAGMVDGYWTPLAARQGVWVTAQLPAAEGEALCRELGNMAPSKSSLDRLSRELGESWEAIQVSEEAVSVSASLDGVMVPMKRLAEAKNSSEKPAKNHRLEKGKGQAGAAKSDAVEAEGKEKDEKKPFYKEASCATLSFYDAAAERLETIRFARMPEPGKKALKAQLSEAVAAVLGQRPEWQLVKLADGAQDNWRFLSDALCPGKGVELVDFFHASEHLNYFSNNRHRMHYATARAQHLPIGSGVTEAACKTLVTQRLKCSGMRWKSKGGQGVLTMRGLIQSNRFDSAWQLLSATYRHTVSMPNNVVPLHAKRR